jgi:hypothetical protein
MEMSVAARKRKAKAGEENDGAKAMESLGDDVGAAELARRVADNLRHKRKLRGLYCAGSRSMTSRALLA